MGILRPTPYEQSKSNICNMLMAMGAKNGEVDFESAMEAMASSVSVDKDGLIVAADVNLDGLSRTAATIADSMSSRVSAILGGAASTYHKCGKKTFYISAGLTRELASTECKGHAKFLQLPYECAYYSLGEQALFISGTDGSRQWSDPINGYYIYKTRIPKTGERVLFILAVADYEGEGAAYVKMTVPLSMIEDSEKIIDKNYCTFIASEINKIEQRKGHQGTDDETVAAIASLAFNILFYINSENVEISNPKINSIPNPPKSKKKKMISRYEKMVNGLSRSSFRELGKSIRITKEAAPERANETGTSFHYTYRFTVRGHFRNQRCGKDLSGIKRIFIRPHMKGPDQAALIHKRYEVRGEAHAEIK